MQCSTLRITPRHFASLHKMSNTLPTGSGSRAEAISSNGVIFSYIASARPMTMHCFVYQTTAPDRLGHYLKVPPCPDTHGLVFCTCMLHPQQVDRSQHELDAHRHVRPLLSLLKPYVPLARSQHNWLTSMECQFNFSRHVTLSPIQIVSTTVMTDNIDAFSQRPKPNEWSSIK